MRNKATNKKRYNLHYRLKKKGLVIRIDSRKKTIYINIKMDNPFDIKEIRSLQEKYDYCIQSEIV